MAAPTEGEKLADKVERLTNELDAMQRQMAACRHEFGEPKATTKDVFDTVLLRYEGHGSDPEPVYEYIRKKEHGWTRVCDICGYRQYTTESKPIVTGFEPDFK
ncbi:MAG: hypothetical protein V1702_04955 [Candidatus Woesearchaeota archaeon]